mmetsp:Transcript_21615/g.69614  ORF Transcript_21615/g.69614 Transcript_21615/m.69614 type:complete len:283 (+) Transcript_21615:67-915(+)
MLGWVHFAYLLHYGVCDRVYGRRVTAWLRRWRIRTDYSTIQSLFLEWIHTLETTAIIAYLTASEAVFVAAVLSLGVCLRLAVKDRRTLIVSRKWRLADVVAALAAGVVAGSRPELVACAHIHAAMVPTRAVIRRPWGTPMVLLLLGVHVLAAGIGLWGLGARHDDYAGVASGALVFLARDLAKAVDVADIRDAGGELRGLARNYQATPEDLSPRPWLFSFFLPAAAADGGKPSLLREGGSFLHLAAMTPDEEPHRRSRDDPSAAAFSWGGGVESQPLTTMPD